MLCDDINGILVLNFSCAKLLSEHPQPRGWCGSSVLGYPRRRRCSCLSRYHWWGSVPHAYFSIRFALFAQRARNLLYAWLWLRRFKSRVPKLRRGPQPPGLDCAENCQEAFVTSDKGVLLAEDIRNIVLITANYFSA